MFQIDLRKDYSQLSLSEGELNPDPIPQFVTWLSEAIHVDLPEPYAMTLATAARDGKPSARVVLLRGVDDRGFTFFTNYESRKGRELEANPFAALVFHWHGLERQVRVEGSTGRVSESESNAYFLNRPPESRLGAWASPQSEVIPDRNALEISYRSFAERYPDDAIPRPPHWGGYRLFPESIEFWQGRPSRLHDRLRYRKQPDGLWVIERLAP